MSKYSEYLDFPSVPYSAAEKAQALYLPTPEDILGPFFKEGAPERYRFIESPDLHLTFMVIDQFGKPIQNAILDIWHADINGKYDNHGFRFRGKLRTDTKGRTRLATVRPGHYPISDDEFRCAHLHAKIVAPEYRELVTQLYFPDDEHNNEDRWFDPQRVITWPFGGFVFVLAKD